MLVQKLFNSEKKQFTTKTPYKKPSYKSYKELLKLDQPRKKIEYQSQSSDEDFLQKLLNAQNEKAKLKKKRKKSLGSARKRQSQQKMRQQSASGKQENKNNNNSEIKLIRDSQLRGLSADRRNHNDLSLIQQQKHQNVKQVDAKPKAMMKSTTKTQSKTLEKGIFEKGTIYIDNKSIQSPPIFYSSTNHLFRSSLTDRKNSAYNLLLKQKEHYLQQIKPKQNMDTLLMNQNRIQHNLNHILESKFSFRPIIEPINPNWRYNLTIAPKMFATEREFVDRKTLFRSKEEQQRFVRSLREISRQKK